MANKRIVIYFSLVGFVVTLLSCAPVDHWLEPPSSSPSKSKQQESSVIFNCNFFRDNYDTLIILALKDASVPAGGPGLRQDLGLYLKNTNRGLNMANVTKDHSWSDFVRFERINRESLSISRKDLPQLEGSQIYAVYLRKLSVSKERLESYQIMGDGDYKDFHRLHSQVSQSINQRKIYFITKRLSKEQSAIYGRKGVNIIEPLILEEGN